MCYNGHCDRLTSQKDELQSEISSLEAEISQQQSVIDNLKPSLDKLLEVNKLLCSLILVLPSYLHTKGFSSNTRIFTATTGQEAKRARLS